MNKFFVLLMALCLAFVAGWLFANEVRPPLLEDGPSQARISMSYSTLLEVTDVEARAASDLAREAYAARFQWDSTEE